MAFNVRLFGYRAIRQIQAVGVNQMNSDSVFVLDEPYLWSQLVSVSGVAAETVVQANDQAQIIRIEVPDNAAVRYEINPQGPAPGSHRTAGNLSPRLTGSDQFAWVQGATVSLIDASGLL